MIIYYIVVLYFIIINIIGFVIMGIDKRKAIKKRWRIRESTLFLIAFVGGSIGAILGMRIFHHKTKHWYFVYGIPLILLIQIAVGVYLILQEFKNAVSIFAAQHDTFFCALLQSAHITFAADANKLLTAYRGGNPSTSDIFSVCHEQEKINLSYSPLQRLISYARVCA